MEQRVEALLEEWGVSSALHLMVDVPRGYALFSKREPKGGLPLVIMTECASVFYLQDVLKAKQPYGLIAESIALDDLQRLLILAAERRKGGFYHGPHLGDNSLSSRERQVLPLLAIGATEDDITKRFKVSKHTVYNWVSRIQCKLNLKNRSQITLYYFDLLEHCQTWLGEFLQNLGVWGFVKAQAL
jgi:DNA-binding CsgD family transcriptional regulator